MRQITVSRIRRYPVTFTARPVQQRRRRGPNPRVHAFFLKLGSAALALLLIIPLFYYMATSA